MADSVSRRSSFSGFATEKIRVMRPCSIVKLSAATIAPSTSTRAPGPPLTQAGVAPGVTPNYARPPST